MNKGNIKEAFRALKTIVSLELRENLNVSFSANKKQGILKVSFYILLLAGLTGIIFLANYLLSTLGVFGGLGSIPLPIFNILFYFIMILITFAAIEKFTTFLFFSKNNKFLLTLPISSRTIYLAKIIVFYILELVKEAPVLLPLLIGYAICCKVPFYFYFHILLCYFIVVLIPIAIAAIICVPYMYFKIMMSRMQLAKSLLTIVLLLAGTMLIFYLLNLLPPNLQIALKWNTVYFPAILNFTKGLEHYFYIFNLIPKMLFNYKEGGATIVRYMSLCAPESYLYLLILFAGASLSIFLMSLLIQPLYVKMNATNEEHHKDNSKIYTKINKNNIDSTALVIALKDNKGNKTSIINYLEKIVDSLNNKAIKENDVIDYLKTNNDEAEFKILKFSDVRNKAPYILLYKDKYILIENELFGKLYFYDKDDLHFENKKHNSIISYIFKDVLLDIREPSRLVNNFLMFIASPVAIFALNSIFNSLNTDNTSKTVIIGINFAIIILISCSSNIHFASIYSKEGYKYFDNKTLPLHESVLATLPLLLRSLLMILSIITSCVIMNNKAPLYYLRADLIAICLILIYLFHLYFSCEQDFLKPKVEMYKEAGANNQGINKNEVVSFIVAIVLAFGFGLISFALIRENLITGYYNILILAAIFAIAKIVFFYIRVCSFKNEIES